MKTATAMHSINPRMAPSIRRAGAGGAAAHPRPVSPSLLLVSLPPASAWFADMRRSGCRGAGGLTSRLWTRRVVIRFWQMHAPARLLPISGRYALIETAIVLARIKAAVLVKSPVPSALQVCGSHFLDIRLKADLNFVLSQHKPRIVHGCQTPAMAPARIRPGRPRSRETAAGPRRTES